MKLIKLTDDYYIIVDDSEIKEGNFVYDSKDKVIRFVKQYLPDEWIKKITYSTQPLNNKFNDWFDAQIITLSEVKELIGEVGVENKAEEKYPKSEFWVGSNPSRLYDENAKERRCFIEGYKQALEDNKDKKYTEEDIVKAIEMAREGIRVTRISEWETEKEFDYNDYQIIQSLQPKTEWEVEFVDGKLKLK